MNNEKVLTDAAAISFWPVAIRCGLIGGLVYSIYTLVDSLSGLSTGGLGMVPAIFSGLSIFVIAIGLIVIAAIHHRDKDLGGYISVGRTVLLGVMVTTISVLISSVFNYIYYYYIDPEYLDRAMSNLEVMLGPWMSEEQLEKMLIENRARMEPEYLIKFSLTVIPIFGLIFSAIVGLIVEKKPPRE